MVTRIIVSDGVLEAPDSTMPPVHKLLFAAGPSHEGNRVRVEALTMPGEIREGDKVELELTYTSSSGTSLDAVLLVDGRKARQWTLPLKVGTHALPLTLETPDLQAGRHTFLVQLLADDDEELDNQAGTTALVLPPRRILYVSGGNMGEEAPAVQRALEAQGVELEVVQAGDIPLGEAPWTHLKAVVLDRLKPSALTDGVQELLKQRVKAGMGLFFIPRDDREALLAWKKEPLGEILPLDALPAPAEEPKKEKKKAPPVKKKSPPKFEKSKQKEVQAPTLLMLLVIDASASMKDGGRMAYALKGAVATLRRLHPEDRIGVIAYDEAPVEVVPVQEASHREAIERAIMRIAPRGGTNIEAALNFARSTLDREEAAVKVVVLLSDGYARPFNVRRVAQEMRASGMSVTTVGIGSSFDISTLTQIAKYSGGTGPIPARNARQLPAVMVDVTSRLMKEFNLRSAEDAKPQKKEDFHRPGEALPAKGQEGSRANAGKKTRTLKIVPVRPTSYLDRLPLESMPPLYGLHPSRPKTSAWVALGVEKSGPVLAHWRWGDGLVVMTTVALEGTRARALLLWDSYSQLLAQVTRFCAWPGSRPRWHLAGRGRGRDLTVELDDSSRRSPPRGWEFRNLPEGSTVEETAPGRCRIRLPQAPAGPFVHLEVSAPGEDGTMGLDVVVEPPREITSRGLSLKGLESWARHLGGRVHTGDWTRIKVPQEKNSRRRAVSWDWRVLAPWFLALFTLELVCKRLARRRDQGRGVAL